MQQCPPTILPSDGECQSPWFLDGGLDSKNVSNERTRVKNWANHVRGSLVAHPAVAQQLEKMEKVQRSWHKKLLDPNLASNHKHLMMLTDERILANLSLELGLDPAGTVIPALKWGNRLTSSDTPDAFIRINRRPSLTRVKSSPELRPHASESVELFHLEPKTND